MSNLTDANLGDSQHQNQSTEIHEPVTEVHGNSEVRKDAKHLSSFQPFSASFATQASAAVSPGITPDLVQQALSHPSIQGRVPTTIVICNHPPAMDKETEDDEEDVNEEFVKKFNEHFGNEKNQAKAQRLLDKMGVLAGLDPNRKPTAVDIPAARMGFAILAGLKNHKFRMIALDKLLLLLEKDEIKKETSIDLVSLTMKLMKQMDRELIQTEILDVQVEIAKAYGAAAELLQHHYAQKHINAVTKELKAQLANTARTLEDLNRQEDPKLSYPVSFALEGVKRLKDDRKELFEIFERICHAVLAAASMYQSDMQAGISELHAAIDNININNTHSWYDGVMLLHQLAKQAKSDPAIMTALLVLVSDTHKKMNWRFLYESIQVLTNIAITSDNSKIRKMAFDGLKTADQKLPGLAAFKDFDAYSIKPDLSPIVHLDRPRMKNKNIFVRKVCVENLVKLTKNSPDKEIRTKAKIALIHRSLVEHDPSIKLLIASVVPEIPQQQKDWLCETGNYTEKENSSVQIDKAPTPQEQMSKAHLHTIPNPQISEIASKVITPDDGQNKPASNPDKNPIAPPLITIPPDSSEIPPCPPSSPRRPNLIAKRLALALGVTPEFLTGKLRYKGSIRPDAKEGLIITEEGMHELADLIVKHKNIAHADLGIFGNRIEGLEHLLRALPQSGVTVLKLPQQISRDEAKLIAAAMESHPSLEATLSEANDYYLLGRYLRRQGLIDAAIKAYTAGIERTNDAEENKKLQHLLLFKRGLCFILSGHFSPAVADLEKALEINPTSIRGALELSRAFQELGDAGKAKIWAQKAYHLKPDDPDSNKQMKIFQKKIL